MSLDEPKNGRTPPVVLAGFACLLSLPLIQLAILPLVKHIHMRGTEWLLLMLLPMAAAFVTLYFSSWHTEFSKTRRIFSGILSSLLIYFVDLIALAMLVAMGCLIIGLTRAVGGN